MQTGFYSKASCDVTVLKTLCAQSLAQSDVPLATAISKNIPLYDMSALDITPALLAEWACVLGTLSGVVVLKNAYADTSVIDVATRVFQTIIEEERSQGASADHFAAAGANDRIWNALQKHCLRDPENFVAYYGNTATAAVCTAWLGPNYQMTAQVNQVRPGGAAQQAHRDYHLGFQSADQASRYPAHAHEVTATLTLQGAVAHCDMPVDSGPTKLLPFSQNYAPGYLGFHLDDHRAYFEEACVQVPLEKGDALFFNPALFHAAGENRSADIDRMANLLQVSSAFGRAMEAIDRHGMCLATYQALSKASDPVASAAIAATAEGYAFPTNLDRDPPVGGNAPRSQADILRQAVRENWNFEALESELEAQRERQKP
jgi:ectoine hydroxylase-related dioxygenase (phytanoyl-CoA dioxygenase family)